MDLLSISNLQHQYRSGQLTVRQLMQSLQARFASLQDNAIFIHWLGLEELEPYLKALDGISPDALPLYGVPFAIKDNIDLAGVPTTAACPAFSYTPDQSAFVVQQLIQAGAVPVGKSNLDQFATGLVGVRSPYGVPGNPLQPNRIPGGSSSGSAVAVARGLAAFALGTDTAGSGRVPAAFQELIGLKPTRGVLSNTGVVPACRSLDCVSIFAHSLQDAQCLFEIVAVRDRADPYARDFQPPPFTRDNETLRIGVPKTTDLAFFGDTAFSEAFEQTLRTIACLPNVNLMEIDFQPFQQAAQLLYNGPWLAERYAAVGKFIEKHPANAVHPVTRNIILAGKNPTAVDAFKAGYELQILKQNADEQLAQVHCILTPTAGKHYSLAEVTDDPLGSNSNLGYYTNFMNLLDYSALAIPGTRTRCGRPFGITLFSFAHQDRELLRIAAYLNHKEYAFQSASARQLSRDSESTSSCRSLQLAVCGAHMQGMALNQQFQALGASFVKTVRSSSHYQLICLTYKTPVRPGMIRLKTGGVSVEMEIWSLPEPKVGRFLESIDSPLGLGSVELADGSWVKGFICEAWVAADAVDISHHGSWRTYLEREPNH